MQTSKKTALGIMILALVVAGGAFWLLHKNTSDFSEETSFYEQYPTEVSCEFIRQDEAPGGLYVIRHERCKLTEEMARKYINFEELGNGALPQEYYPMTLRDTEGNTLFEWGIEYPASGFPLSAQDGAVGARWRFVFLDEQTILLEKRSDQDIRTVTISQMEIPSLKVTELITHQFDVPMFGFSLVEETSESFIFSPQVPNSISTKQKLSLDKQTREITLIIDSVKE